jgi:hypothetical protein
MPLTKPRWWHSRKAANPFPWRPEWDELAHYNGLKAKGVMFQPEKVERMKQMQQDYNEAFRRHHEESGDIILS